MDSLTLTLAGTPYTIQELTIGQLEDIHIELGRPSSGDPKEIWQSYRRVIAIGLSVDHPAVTEESLKKVRLGTIQATKAVFESILKFGGFGQKAGSAAGEAPARAA